MVQLLQSISSVLAMLLVVQAVSVDDKKASESDTRIVEMANVEPVSYQDQSCQQTRTCFGIAYGSSYACNHDYKYSYPVAGGKKACDGFALYSYKCCGIKKKTCKWSYCTGFLVTGASTCKEYGSEWEYDGKTRSNDCSFSKSQVECCKYE
ncbi:hypothetical protein CU098_009945 [Rhizopus stolonifer]|uniref:Uncharacterized protein n=1 Tax=Rhizopus stolonifer TaxID=4846 RepID=A0A367KU71_RHIST|nr:hypothetical protein CU098_009945 [Rhizopus stolonifer]